MSRTVHITVSRIQNSRDLSCNFNNNGFGRDLRWFKSLLKDVRKTDLAHRSSPMFVLLSWK